MSEEPESLRLLTYLAPGLPLELFEAVASRLARSLPAEVSLACDTTCSAPPADGSDPFSTARADVGFMCAPGYIGLADRVPPAVELVRAAFLFDDPRNLGRPVYFADVLVAEDCTARALEDLRGARWAYNDASSLSGYFALVSELDARGLGLELFSSASAEGSHHAALRALQESRADVAAIDSNTLLHERRAGRARGLRVLLSLGPFPVQPIVVRAGLSRLAQPLARALLSMHQEAQACARLSACGVTRFVPVRPADYEVERARLARLRARGRAPRRASARCGDDTGAPAEPA